MKQTTILAIITAGLLYSAPAVADEPVKVLILTGDNNHNWKATTPVLVKILTDAKRFDVAVTEHPEKLAPEALSRYDVLVSNWNCRRRRDAPEWPAELKQAYADFVREGKGHVVVHAGSSSLYEWKEYQEICTATWKNGQTNHGRIHAFPVRMTKVQHPITKGLAGFETTDELWNRPGIQKGATVLAESFSAKDKSETGNWEPTAIVRDFGKGRCVALLLGHDAKTMQNAGFQVLFARGTEWAATGKVTVMSKQTTQPVKEPGSPDTKPAATPTGKGA